jgi:Uma2 family endonuclease
MTYEEFLAWAGDDVRAEWVDGEVIVFMAVGRRHVYLISFLFGLLKAYVGLRRLGEVFGEPFPLSSGPGGERRPAGQTLSS